jgi:O-antigen ligase
MFIPARAGTAATWLIENWRWLLVLSVLPLFSSKALYHVPLVLMALLGLTHAMQHRRTLLHDPAACFIIAIFLALWLPQLAALPGAIAPAESLRVTLTYIGYPLAALFIAVALAKQQHRERLMIGVACVAGIWGADVIAGATGVAPWTIPEHDPRYIADSLLGRLSLGHVLAVLSPLMFELVRRHCRRPWAWLLLLVMVLFILLSGRRVAWLLFLIAGLAYLVYLAWITRRLQLRWLLIPVVLLIAITSLFYWQHEPSRQRIDTTAELFSADVERIDRATSHRLDIWTTAYRMAQSNWLNGVGARGFRYAYDEYAAADNFWLQNDRPRVTHPHQFVLEIAAETGLPGLLGYLIVWIVLWQTLKRIPPADNPWAWPGAIALGLALFPLNAHIAFYGAYWSALLWWLIGINAITLSPSRRAG